MLRCRDCGYERPGQWADAGSAATFTCVLREGLDASGAQRRGDAPNRQATGGAVESGQALGQRSRPSLLAPNGFSRVPGKQSAATLWADPAQVRASPRGNPAKAFGPIVNRIKPKNRLVLATNATLDGGNHLVA